MTATHHTSIPTTTPVRLIRDSIEMMRPHQWLKNGFIFLPLFFSLNLNQPGLLMAAAIAFAGFSLCASGIYVFNDIHDVAEDRQHPTKQHRPIASGRISVAMAGVISVGLILVGYGLLGWLGNTLTLGVLGAYILMNIAYSLGLKHIAILDITLIAIGFVLRVFAGAFAISIEPSMWIIVMTFLLALFLASAKRREDIILAGQGHQTRKNIDGYNKEFVNAIMLTMAAVTLVAYMMYTISPEVTAQYGSRYLYVTTLFVTMGILRYMQGTFVEDNSGCPTRFLVRDRFLQLTIVGWLLSFVVLIYL
ncbi:MAG: decaprenyl-phosphate phosphoribosyltransferase [Vampirovibrio sp.]|nr:decaprenyl-phosphate phosphoribosyltransferase [Vampirovibrio sp.]